MHAKKLKLASIIVTHNRVLEAKAQMDIIRELWQPLFAKVDIYHEFNGQKEWHPKTYKEDFLHRHRKMPHFIGANHLLNQGIKHVLRSGRNYDFIIAASADAWFYDPVKLKKIILTCTKKRYQLVTSVWGGVVLSTEFFIITPGLAKKVFPLNFTRFLNKVRLLKWTYTKISIFEHIFTFKVIKVLKNPGLIYLIPGRRAIWPTNRFHSPNFYASHHSPQKRKKDIAPQIFVTLGRKIETMPYLHRFLS